MTLVRGVKSAWQVLFKKKNDDVHIVLPFVLLQIRKHWRKNWFFHYVAKYNIQMYCDWTIKKRQWLATGTVMSLLAMHFLQIPVSTELKSTGPGPRTSIWRLVSHTAFLTVFSFYFLLFWTFSWHFSVVFFFLLPYVPVKFIVHYYIHYIQRIVCCVTLHLSVFSIFGWPGCFSGGAETTIETTRPGQSI